jgi:hypothetical protein
LVTAVAIVAVMLAVVAGPSFGHVETINNNACTKGEAEKSPKIFVGDLPKEEIPGTCVLNTGT